MDIVFFLIKYCKSLNETDELTRKLIILTFLYVRPGLGSWLWFWGAWWGQRDRFCPPAPCKFGWPKSRAADTQCPKDSCFSSSFHLVHFGEARKGSSMLGSPPRALVSSFLWELNLSGKIFNYGVYSFDSWPLYLPETMPTAQNYLWEANSQNTWKQLMPFVFYS